MLGAKLKRLRMMIGLLVCAALVGCQTAKPQTASVIVQPTTPIVKNMTSFSNSLQCMDQLFLAYGKRDIVITSAGLPDSTNTINAGTKDMMITTLSRMSERSNAFRFIDIEVGNAVDYIQNLNSSTRNFEFPHFYIRGAITQVDRNVASDSKSVGVALPFASLGFSDDQVLSVVTIDLNLGDVVKRQIIPGLSTTNTITVVNRGRGVDTEAIIKKASLFFQMSQDRNQGTHQSVRTLIELGLIELLGKLTKVPYWRCLEMNSTDPAVIQQARGWFDEMPEPERERVVQAAMAQIGYYRGPLDGQMSAPLREAINRYKAENTLIADGRVDFDLYHKLVADNHAVIPQASVPSAGQSPREKQTPYAPMAAEGTVANSLGRDQIGLKISHEGGDDKVFAVGDKLSFSISVERAASVYCYYEYTENGVVNVSRIFPNRWQSNPRIEPKRPVTVPSLGAAFQIDLRTPGVDETVACVATEAGYTPKTQPAVLREPDLASLGTGKRLFHVVDEHLKIDRFGATVQNLRWKVR